MCWENRPRHLVRKIGCGPPQNHAVSSLARRLAGKPDGIVRAIDALRADITERIQHSCDCLVIFLPATL
jgi:hypothetical protein